MSNKVREVLQGRLSELDGSFSTEVPLNSDSEKIKVGDKISGFEIVFQVV